MIDLEKELKVFNLGQLQDFKTIAKTLIGLNISIEYYIKYVEEKIDVKVKSRPPKMKHKKCPDCRANMVLLPVNYNKATITGDDSSSCWTCTNENCMEVIYNKQTVQEILE